MAPTQQAADTPLPPPPVTPGGTYAIETVTVGCKLYIKRPGINGEVEERLAEILSIRDKHINPYFHRTRVTKGNQNEKQEDTKPEDKWEFFVHWDSFNKRLDEWVAGSRLVLSRDLEWPRPKPPEEEKNAKGGSATGRKPPGKVPRSKATIPSTAAASPMPASRASVMSSAAPSPGPMALKRKAPHDEEEEEEIPQDDEDLDAEGEMDVDAEGEIDDSIMDDAFEEQQQHSKTPAFSNEPETVTPRPSRSMTQSVSEIARVKNLNRLQIGKNEVEAWYFSPYPKEYAHLPVLYICEFCLSYFPSPMMLSRHRRRCNLLHPPGNEIYREGDLSFWELDGKRQLTWCRNLSLLSKCFLDHKKLYWDVTPFMYYVMTQRDSTGCHIIGYFSKEKESAENFNVACILTLPQHQRHGYGKLLIEFSYELSKKEGKVGSPEKPLSDLGLLSYRAYWEETIVDLLCNSMCTVDEISIDDIARKTSITHADVMNTCIMLELFKHYKGQNIICLSEAVMERHAKAQAKRRRRIHPENLIWKPPVFTRDQLRFGW